MKNTKRIIAALIENNKITLFRDDSTIFHWDNLNIENVESLNVTIVDARTCEEYSRFYHSIPLPGTLSKALEPNGSMDLWIEKWKSLGAIVSLPA